jgi:hypothetical protein
VKYTEERRRHCAWSCLVRLVMTSRRMSGPDCQTRSAVVAVDACSRQRSLSSAGACPMWEAVDIVDMDGPQQSDLTEMNSLRGCRLHSDIYCNLKGDSCLDITFGKKPKAVDVDEVWMAYEAHRWRVIYLNTTSVNLAFSRIAAPHQI